MSTSNPNNSDNEGVRICNAKTELLDELVKASEAHHSAIATLVASPRTLPSGEYVKLSVAAAEAARHAGRLRELLRRHTESHGC
jgi:hypothetical protein